MPEAAQSFWQFSLALYAAPGVAAACLVLQDRHGRDVNLALYCCWVGASGRGRLTAAGIAAADAALRPWRRRVVEPLRAARRSIKGMAGAEALYDAVKAVELRAEQHAHGLLAAAAPAAQTDMPEAERRAAAAANLALYLGDAAAAAAPILAALGGPILQAATSQGDGDGAG